MSRVARSALPRGRRPGLRMVVIGPAVAVMVAMAIVVSNAVADELRRSATESAVHGVEAIVRGYVDPGLSETSLDLDAARDPAIDGQLERLTQSGEIRRINIWTRDGRIVYSSLPDLRGRRFSIGTQLSDAFAGDGVASYADGVAGPAAAPASADGTAGLPVTYLELFVPIRGAVDGNPIGVYHVFQDAGPIEERIGGTRASVFVVALIASSLLSLLIWLAFGGASRVLARQNRLLEEQATTERLLVVDVQRSEERFRSLVQNASDGVLVLDESGLVRYASPALERVLGRPAESALNQSPTEYVHPGDRKIVERRLMEAAATDGSEVALEFRARHADGSWRNLQAIAKNLLDDPAVNGVVVNYRDVTERTALEQELRHQAFHDVLTGLANRSLFRDRLGHALARASRAARPTAVLYLDLDEFKEVNDRYGHVAGDRLLVAVGQRLRQATRAEDTVARLGGDEFAIIVEEHETAEAGVAAGRILGSLAAPFHVDGVEIAVRGSIGIGIGSAVEDGDELLRRADIAMYAAKARGGDCHVTYEAELYDSTISRMELKADLRGALARGELHVEYQPIVDIETAAILGTEALLRWEHPTRGPIAPLDFISLAEDGGLILEMGRFVLDTACRQTRAWQVASGRDDLSISVNLSGRQIADPNLVVSVAEVLASSRLDARALTLEITESVLVEDVGQTVAVMRALKALGISLAIDDFGTGFSSLSYLRQFPIDILKVDRSFVAGLDGGSDSVVLVRSILNLCSTLQLDAVAEGIETEEQRWILHRLGARRGQGYLFARPMSPAAFPALLERGLAAVAEHRPRANGAARRRSNRAPRTAVQPRATRP